MSSMAALASRRLQHRLLLAGGLAFEHSFGEFHLDGAQQSGDDEAVAADVPARLEAEAVMGFADAGDRLDVAVVELAGDDVGPVLDLHLLGVPHHRLVGEEFLRLRRRGDADVEIVEHQRQNAGDQGLHFAQRGAHAFIDADEGQSGFKPAIIAHCGSSRPSRGRNQRVSRSDWQRRFNAD